MKTPIHVNFTSFFFADHSTPVGLLPHDRRAQACWYYVTCAHKSLADSTDPIVYEGELDPLPSLANLIHAISMQFGIQDPTEMLKFLDLCKQECQRLGYAWDDRVTKVKREDYIRRVIPQ